MHQRKYKEQRMKKDHTANPSQLVEFAPDSYLDRTSRPIYALAFLSIFLVLYELGTIIISPEIFSESLSAMQIRVVSFIWLQNLVKMLGFSSRTAWLMTPLIVVIILLALQVTSRKPWKIRFGDIAVMSVECVMMAMPLIALSMVLNRHLAVNAVTPLFTPAVQGQSSQLLVDVVTGIGAGIYEELVFRLILICLLMVFFQDFLKMARKNAIILSVLISAALFSIHHHIYYLGGSFETAEAFTIAKFVFRTAAGIYFAAIFAIRGFGIVAGAHACYDIIAAVLNAMHSD